MKIGIIVAMGGRIPLGGSFVEREKRTGNTGVPLCDRTVGGEGNRLDTVWYR